MVAGVYIPMVLDVMGDSVNTAYNALPERLYLLPRLSGSAFTVHG